MDVKHKETNTYFSSNCSGTLPEGAFDLLGGSGFWGVLQSRFTVLLVSYSHRDNVMYSSQALARKLIVTYSRANRQNHLLARFLKRKIISRVGPLTLHVCPEVKLSKDPVVARKTFYKKNPTCSNYLLILSDAVEESIHSWFHTPRFTNFKQDEVRGNSIATHYHTEAYKSRLCKLPTIEQVVTVEN